MPNMKQVTMTFNNGHEIYSTVVEVEAKDYGFNFPIQVLNYEADHVTICFNYFAIPYCSIDAIDDAIVRDDYHKQIKNMALYIEDVLQQQNILIAREAVDEMQIFFAMECFAEIEPVEFINLETIHHLSLVIFKIKTRSLGDYKQLPESISV